MNACPSVGRNANLIWGVAVKLSKSRMLSFTKKFFPFSSLCASSPLDAQNAVSSLFFSLPPLPLPSSWPTTALARSGRPVAPLFKVLLAPVHCPDRSKRRVWWNRNQTQTLLLGTVSLSYLSPSPSHTRLRCHAAPPAARLPSPATWAASPPPATPRLTTSDPASVEKSRKNDERFLPIPCYQTTSQRPQPPPQPPAAALG